MHGDCRHKTDLGHGCHGCRSLEQAGDVKISRL